MGGSSGLPSDAGTGEAASQGMDGPIDGEFNMPESDEGVLGGEKVTEEQMGKLDSRCGFITSAPTKRGGGPWQNDDCPSQSHELAPRECDLPWLPREDVFEVEQEGSVRILDSNGQTGR